MPIAALVVAVVLVAILGRKLWRKSQDNKPSNNWALSDEINFHSDVLKVVLMGVKVILIAVLVMAAAILVVAAKIYWESL